MFPFSTPSFLPERDLPDLTGKVIFVTGANHGIGLATVKHLARRGAKVYLGARSESKAKAAIASLEAEFAKPGTKDATRKVVPGKVIYHHCDLSSPKLAKQSAEKFIERESKLDILINNAGLLANAPIPEQIMVVNHFGPFQITQTLLPLLIKTAKGPSSDVRIIFLGSEVHDQSRAKDRNIHFRTLEDFKQDYSKDWLPNFSKYCVSKLANVLTLKALQRRVDEHNITCLVVHPGSVNTFMDDHPILGFMLSPLLSLYFVTPDVGAYNSCFAAGSPVVSQDKKYRGAYLEPVGKFTGEGANARNEALQEEIWESTMRILQDGSLEAASE